MIRRRRRIWIETLERDRQPRAAAFRRAEILDLLVRFDLEPLLAVQAGAGPGGEASWEPGGREDAEGLVRACEEAGLRPGLWPMLGDARGRYAHVGNAGGYAAFAREVAGLLPAGSTLAVDLEPPFAATRVLFEGRPSLDLGKEALRTLRELAKGHVSMAPIYALAGEARARGIEVLAAVPPSLAFGEGLGILTGTPIRQGAFDRVSAMAYSSIAQGLGRGVLTRARTERLFAATARAMRKNFDDRGSLSIGAVGPGAFAVERSYRSPSELARDVALAEAAGITDLALFDLGGVLQRPPGDAWLEAFTGKSERAVR